MATVFLERNDHNLDPTRYKISNPKLEPKTNSKICTKVKPDFVYLEKYLHENSILH